VRYERKQGKIEKKQQKVYFMPKSIECASAYWLSTSNKYLRVYRSNFISGSSQLLNELNRIFT